MTKPNNRLQNMLHKLREHNYKITPQRVEIFKILAESKGHPSAEQVHQKVVKVFPATSLATVYRNILKLKELGEVIELGFSDGSNRYDGNKPYPHPHVVCLDCEKIIDPESTHFKDMTEKIAGETGFEIVSHRIDFFGVCPECQANRY